MDGCVSSPLLGSKPSQPNSAARSHSFWIADVHVRDAPRGYDGCPSPDGGFASY